MIFPSALHSPAGTSRNRGRKQAPLDTVRHASENPTFGMLPPIRECEFALGRSIHRLAFDIHCRTSGLDFLAQSKTSRRFLHPSLF